MVCQLTDDQAYEVMMQAHKFGSAVVGQYSQETAEVRTQVVLCVTLVVGDCSMWFSVVNDSMDMCICCCQ